ncbi:MAG: hypothetical protein KME04_13940 [Pleurocapsa minor GSE-CHR-MK-17-07R]|jgi:uncharacterized protein YfaS (alpha-2-macroglobulin family)|nr:hypothetical protein [Pleurocapsa minor GSE-CHR-MK 17-07R]
MRLAIFVIVLLALCANGANAQTEISLVQRIPDAGAVNIATDGAITVVFSQPVIALLGIEDSAALPDPVNIIPDIAGTGEWLNTVIWRFTPDEPFPASSVITVETDPSFRSAEGDAIAADRWQFTTRTPRINYVELYDGEGPKRAETPLGLDWSIVLGFSQPIDPRAFVQLIALRDADGAPVLMTYEQPNDRSILVNPVDLLEMDEEYTIFVSDIRDGQRLLEAPFTQTFRTIPFPSVVSVYPEADRHISIDEVASGAQMQFATTMDLDSLRGLLQLEPDTVAWQPRADRYDLSKFYIDFEPTVGETYTITLLPGALDVYGNAITSEITWSFTVTEPLPLQISLHAYPVIRNSFSVTNAYREDTRMAMRVSGDEDLIGTMELYRAGDIAESMGAVPEEDASYPRESLVRALSENGDLVRTWQQTFNGGGGMTSSEILLAGETGGRLEPGLYVVQTDFSPTDPDSRIRDSNLLLAVSTAILTVQRGPTETLVWVTDMETGLPVRAALVSVYGLDSTPARAYTDHNGIARVAKVTLPEPGCYFECYPRDYVMVTAEAPGVYGAWYTEYVIFAQAEVGNLYTDRSVYRPGETVYFRGVLRDRADMTYTIPQDRQIVMQICTQGNLCLTDSEGLFRRNVTISSMGTFNGSVTLPEDAPPGEYFIETDSGFVPYENISCWDSFFGEPYCDSYPSRGTQFRVATFETPEFEMTAAPAAPEGMQGEPLGVVVNATLFSGGPLQDAAVTWRISAYARAFQYEDYAFADPEVGGGYYGDNRAMQMTLTTGADGSAIIPTEQITGAAPLQVQMHVQVAEGAESHDANLDFYLHSTDVYVGLRRPQARAEQGSEVALDVITVTRDRQIAPNRPVAYTVEHLRREQRPGDMYGYYVIETIVTPVSSGRVMTGHDGSASIPVLLEEVGRYRVRAETLDDEGRLHSSVIEIAVGPDPVIPFQAVTYEDKTFAITPDRAGYRPGDTARLSIQTPGSGTLLLTIQRQRVQRAFVLPVHSSEPLTFELPLGNEDAPNIYVTGTFVQGVQSENDSPSYAVTSLALGVEPLHRLLNVEISASTTTAAPGETVTFDVRVTDQRGIPVVAELGMALVDEAILSLWPPYSPSLVETFYGWQSNQVTWDISLCGLIDDLVDTLGPPGMGGGGGGSDTSTPTSIDPRQDFEVTPLWLPNVFTDENGSASASVVLPDNLTRWRFDVRAVSLSTLVGQADMTITSSLPFFIRPQTPRFLVAGDIVELAMFAHNQTDTAQTVTASLVADGVTLLDDAEQIVTLPPFSQQRIMWLAQVNDTDGVELTFAAGNGSVQDSARPNLPDNRIPVFAYTATETVATAGFLDGEGTVTERIVPPKDALESELIVSLTSSLVDTALAAENAYPLSAYDTSDRMIARLMINTALYQVSPSATLAEEVERDIQALLDRREGLNRLWAWASNGPDSPVLSGYATIALSQAADAGFDSADGPAQVGCSLLFNSYGLPALDGAAADATFNTVALAQYVYTICERENRDEIMKLYDFRDRLSPAAQGLLLLTVAEEMPEIADVVTNGLLASALMTATGTHWEGENRALWDTDTLTTSLVLSALMETSMGTEFLPAVLRWLTTARTGDIWSSPLETAWSVRALVTYARQYEAPSAEYQVGVSLDETQIVPTRPAAGLSEQFVLPLNPQQYALTLERGAGDGTLYYTAALQSTLEAATAPSVSRGTTVVREYLNAEGELISSVRLGDTVFVRLTVLAPQDIYYFVLNDALPAGLAADDPSLINTPTSGISIVRSLPQDDLQWYFGASAFSRSVFTDTNVLFYADVLPAGTYIVTYEARAGAAGQFQAMPTHAYASVTPDVFGRSAGAAFNVLSHDAP